MQKIQAALKALFASILISTTVLAAQSRDNVLDMVTRLKDIQAIITGYISFYEHSGFLKLLNQDGIKRILCDPSGNYFLTVSLENFVTLWDSKKLTPIRSYAHGEISNIAFVAHAIFIITKNNLLYKKGVACGLPLINPVKIDGDTRLLNVSDSSPVITAGQKTITVWDSNTLALQTKLKLQERIFALSTRPGKTEIALISQSGISLWDYTSNNKIKLENRFAPVNWCQIAYAPNGKILIARSTEALSSWQTYNQKQINFLKNENGSFIHTAFLPDGQSFAALSINFKTKESTIIFFDLESFLPLYIIKSDKTFTYFAFTQDHTYLLIGSRDNFIELYKNPLSELQISNNQATKKIVKKQPPQSDCVIS